MLLLTANSFSAVDPQPSKSSIYDSVKTHIFQTIQTFMVHRSLSMTFRGWTLKAERSSCCESCSVGNIILPKSYSDASSKLFSEHTQQDTSGEG